MMTMREKVARAIYPAIVDGGDYSEVPFESMMNRPRYQHLRERVMFSADEAMKAMREPTDAMFAAAPPSECPSYIDDLWHDMIDAALEETTTPSLSA